MGPSNEPTTVDKATRTPKRTFVPLVRSMTAGKGLVRFFLSFLALLRINFEVGKIASFTYCHVIHSPEPCLAGSAHSGLSPNVRIKRSRDFPLEAG